MASLLKSVCVYSNCSVWLCHAQIIGLSWVACMSFWDNLFSFPFGIFLANIKGRSPPVSHSRSFWMACKDSCLVIKKIPLQTLDPKTEIWLEFTSPEYSILIDARVGITQWLFCEYLYLSTYLSADLAFSSRRFQDLFHKHSCPLINVPYDEGVW